MAENGFPGGHKGKTSFPKSIEQRIFLPVNYEITAKFI